MVLYHSAQTHSMCAQVAMPCCLPPLQVLQRQSQAVKVQLQGLAAELEQALAEEADKALLLAGGLAVGR